MKTYVVTPHQRDGSTDGLQYKFSTDGSHILFIGVILKNYPLYPILSRAPDKRGY